MESKDNNGVGNYVVELRPLDEECGVRAEKSLRQLCREYAFVPFRSEPYDSKLGELSKSILKSYEVFCNHKGESEDIVKYRKALEEACIIKEKFSERVRGLFSREEMDFGKLGEILINKEKELNEMSKVLHEAYNQRLEGLRDFASGISVIRGFIDNYRKKQEELEERIVYQYRLESNVEARNIRLEELLEKKEEEEQKNLGGNEKRALIDFFISKGRKMFEQTCKEYLESEHDKDIAKSLMDNYGHILNKYHEVVESFDAVRGDFLQSTLRLKRNLALYALVTKKELELLKEVYIPKKFIETVNFLVGQIEEIDKKFSQRALEILVREKPYVKEAVMSLEHEVIRKLEEGAVGDNGNFDNKGGVFDGKREQRP